MSTPLELAAAIIQDAERVQVYEVQQKPDCYIKNLRAALNKLGYRADKIRLAVVPGTNEICAKKAEK